MLLLSPVFGKWPLFFTCWHGFSRSSILWFWLWKGKSDLLSRSVVVQPTLFGGFSVVSVKFKVWSLVAEWIKRFASSPSSWSALMTYWFQSCFNATHWRPRIDAVERCLNSWRSHSLSLSGKALIINALALSRIWYCRELNRIIFNFFWSGKCDLVARNVVIQPLDLGGFSVVSIQFKVYSLLTHWSSVFW